MKIEAGKWCPLIKEDCVGLKCVLMTQLRGTNPNTGQPVDEWGCSLAWLPMLLIENTQQARQCGAATESMRNEIIKRMDTPPPTPTEMAALMLTHLARGRQSASPGQIVERTPET